MPERAATSPVNGIALVCSAIGLGLSAVGIEHTITRMLAVFLAIVVMLAIGVAHLFRRDTQRGTPFERRIPALAILLLASVAVLNWPLHAGYRIARARFDEVARRARAGEHIVTPLRIGLF